MPMSYLYGKRFVGPITGLIQLIRQELYNEPYHQINWNKARSTIAKVIRSLFAFLVHVRNINIISYLLAIFPKLMPT